MSEVERLIGMCEYHARKAADRHDFFAGKSRATYRVEAAKNALDWATFYADLSTQLRKLLPTDL